MDRKETVLLALKQLGVNCENKVILSRQTIEAKLPFDFTATEVEGQLRALHKSGLISLGFVQQEYVLKMESASAVVFTRLEEEAKRVAVENVPKTVVPEPTPNTHSVTESGKGKENVIDIVQTGKKEEQAQPVKPIVPWKRLVATCFFGGFLGSLIACVAGIATYWFLLK